MKIFGKWAWLLGLPLAFRITLLLVSLALISVTLISIKFGIDLSIQVQSCHAHCIQSQSINH